MVLSMNSLLALVCFVICFHHIAEFEITPIIIAMHVLVEKDLLSIHKIWVSEVAI